jgi:hypothetical protein
MLMNWPTFNAAPLILPSLSTRRLTLASLSRRDPVPPDMADESAPKESPAARPATWFRNTWRSSNGSCAHLHSEKVDRVVTMVRERRGAAVMEETACISAPRSAQHKIADRDSTNTGIESSYVFGGLGRLHDCIKCGKWRGIEIWEGGLGWRWRNNLIGNIQFFPVADFFAG